MLDFQRRTHACGAIAEADIGQTVRLYGWVHRVRDLGGLLFVDLRDVTGICQVVFDPAAAPEAFKASHSLRCEYVVKIEGEVRRRPEGTTNPSLPTGAVEVLDRSLSVLNTSAPLPFPLNEEAPVSEALRLKYRYLDLRRPEVQRSFTFRSRFLGIVRRTMEAQGFYELETPILTRSTPEGARDFLVPSRQSPGSFFALPQSPQLFKQLLMISGFDRYFQICRCFRDEDLRSDRQPEFTQLDVETSFLPPEALFEIIEHLFETIGRELGFAIRPPFPRMPYAEAMERYGCDKPDTRFGMLMRTVSDLVKGSEFRVFADAIKAGGEVRAMPVPGAAAFSRSEIDALVARAQALGARGLAWAKVGDDLAVTSPIAKFVGTDTFARIVQASEARPGDLVLMIADRPAVAAQVMCTLRLELGARLELIEPGRLCLLWVVDFPWLEWNEGESRWDAKHHPFTKPVIEDLERHSAEPGRIRAQAYDLVLNGHEIGGGSVRIHRPDLQEKMFEYLNIPREEARAKFGFLLDALSYGAPPHGGIALGIDRIVALLLGHDSLREVIAFPKTAKGQCLMTEAPSSVARAQLDELKIALKD